MVRSRTSTSPVRLAAVAAALLSSLVVACSCSDEPAGAGATSGAAGGAGGDGAGSPVTTGVYSSSSSSGGGGDGATGGVPTPKPCPGYDGWETWDDYAPDGDFCVPATEAALPAPIEWELCDPSVGLGGGCQQMKITWPTDAAAISSSVYGWVDRQTVYLSFVRNAFVGGTYHRTFVVAEADGPARSAFMDMNGVQGNEWQLYSPGEAAMRQGKFIFSVLSNATPGEIEQAAIGGSIGELHPKVLGTWEDLTWIYSLGVASEFWLARGLSDVFIADWGGPLELVHTAGQGNGGTLNSFYPFGDFLVWEDSPHPSSTLWAYKKGAAGAFPLVAYDPTKRLDAFATDGIHMVWVRTHDVKSVYEVTPYEDSARDIMVSPYSETAAGLQPQRLRSYPSIYGLVPDFAVGCGYAAHGGTETGKAILVRLSDGYSWMLPMANCTPPSTAGEFCVANPVAVTCEEVFVRIDGSANIARMSIDALGPPTPPD